MKHHFLVTVEDDESTKWKVDLNEYGTGVQIQAELVAGYLTSGKLPAVTVQAIKFAPANPNANN